MTILFYPDNLNHYCRLFNIVSELGIKFHNNPNYPYNHFFYWSYHKTFRPHDEMILKNKSRVINFGCYDISKSRVENIFKSGIAINPETHQGVCVVKSENQAMHDGKIIQCPTKQLRGLVYQKLIDAKEDGRYVYYRVFTSDGRIDFAIKITKPDIFKTNLNELRFEEINFKELFTESDIASIESGVRDFGLDFGELDVLKDKDKFYVIDVNNIAGGIFTKPIMQQYKQTFIDFLEKRKIA